MKTTLSETSLSTTRPAVQLHKPLMPIDAYMAREGVSESVVEEYRQLGIVQIRRHKGKTYVIEIPLEPYPSEPEAAQQTARPGGEAGRAEQVSEPAEKVITAAVPAEAEKSREETVKTAKRLQFFVQLLLAPANIAGRLKRIVLSVGRLCVKLLVMAGRLTKSAKSKLERIVRIPKLARSPRQSAGRVEIARTATESRIAWRIPAGAALILLAASLVTNGWLFIDRQRRIDRLEYAYAGIMIKHNNYIKARLQNDSLQAGLDDFSAEINLLRNELNNSAEQVQNLRDQLMQAMRDIQIIKQHNAETQAQLNERIRNLTARPRGLTGRLRTLHN